MGGKGVGDDSGPLSRLPWGNGLTGPATWRYGNAHGAPGWSRRGRAGNNFLRD